MNSGKLKQQNNASGVSSQNNNAIQNGNCRLSRQVSLRRRIISYVVYGVFVSLISIYDLLTLGLLPTIAGECRPGSYPDCKFSLALQTFYFIIKLISHELAHFNGLINAFASIVIAVFTYTLWRTNEKLWKTSDGQLQSFRQSSAESSETAKFQRKRLVSQFGLIRRQSRLLESQLQLQIMLSRPIIHPIYETAIVVNPTTKEVYAFFDIQLKNIGHSPAIRMKSWWKGNGFQSIPTEPIHFEEISSDYPGINEERNLPPQRSWNSGKNELTHEELMGILEGTRPFYIWGKCEFSGIFDNTTRYWMTHCAELVCPNAFKGKPEALIEVVKVGENRGAFPPPSPW